MTGNPLKLLAVTACGNGKNGASASAAQRAVIGSVSNCGQGRAAKRSCGLAELAQSAALSTGEALTCQRLRSLSRRKAALVPSQERAGKGVQRKSGAGQGFAAP